MTISSSDPFLPFRTNGVTTTYGYDGRGLISSVQHTNGGALAKRDYWRDDRDRIRAWKRGSDQSYNLMENGRGNRYEYDDEGQLTQASYRAENPENGATTPYRNDIFHYDKMGNRMGWNYLANRGTMLFKGKNNGLNQYFSWENSYPPPGALHWGTTTNYDDDLGAGWGQPGRANGVLMQEGWITGFYNALNQPVGITTTGWIGTGTWMWFGYDPLGRCVKRWTGPNNGQVPPAYSNPATTTYFTYDGWNLIQEGASGVSPSRVYVHGGRTDEIVASWAGGNWIQHQYDAQGNCIMLTDIGGNILEQYDYDAFGYPYFYSSTGQQLTSSTTGNRFLFTGREWIKELRLYDYRARMYQPELGRFLQPDPQEFTAGDYNLYRYCHNDPVNRSDPTGLESLTASIWNHEMWMQSGTLLTSRGFDLWKQGSAYLARPTGNYKNTNVNDHVPKNGEIGSEPGGTIYNPNLDKAREVAGVLVIEPTLNWYVQRNYLNTTVVTSELEHVNRYLYWHGEGDFGAAVRSFNRNPNGFDALKSKLKKEYREETVWHENNIHKNFRHQLQSFPEKRMDPNEIIKAIQNVRPVEEPYLGQ
jgi:RHS repeat-associated protein